MKAIFILLFFVTCFTGITNAQDIYFTPNGTIQFSGTWGDTVLNGTSDEVSIILNHETAEFVLRLEANTLKTGIDSLDEQLDSLHDFTLRYKGRFDLEFIHMEPHHPQKFEVDGYVFINDHEAGIMHGKGRIEHTADGTYPCLLTLSFTVDTDLLEFSKEMPTLGKRMVIEVNQALLDKEL